MAQPSNQRRASDLAELIQIRCGPDIDQVQSLHGSLRSNIAANDSGMQIFPPRERHNLSEVPLGHHESNRRIRFDEAHQTLARSHVLPGRHCTWGCVRCNTLPFLNSPFQPTEHFYDNKVPRSSNNSNHTDMYLNATTTGPVRSSRQYTTPLLSTPGNQGNLLPQYANMCSFEQQNTPLRASVTPSLTHSSTPQSVFSAPRTSPNTGQSACDWGTPATIVKSYIKEQSPRYEVPLNGQSGQFHNLSKDIIEASDDFDARFISDEGNQNEQWLQDADVDDLHYRRGSESVAAQQQSQEQVFQRLPGDFVAAGNLDMIDSAKQFQTHSYMQSTYQDSEPILGQQYFTLEPRAFNPLDLEFSNPFAPNNTVDFYNTSSAFDAVNPYDSFKFNDPLYQDAEYPLPASVIPSNDFLVESNGNQSHCTGPSRSRHNARNDGLDRKLVEWRESGMSYKEIMAKGNFGLEESTLRGRYRTLTKSKEKRLRKPVWDDHAISALLQAVEHHAPAGSKGSYGKESLDKIPWKRVAEWMEKERKCYLYGNATVKKKYIEVIKSRRLSRRQTTV